MANIKLKRIAEVIKIAAPECQEILKGLLVEALPAMDRGVYEFIRTHPYPSITSKEIAESFEIRMNYAGNILGRLRGWGLIESAPQTGADGLYYEWRIRGD